MSGVDFKGRVVLLTEGPEKLLERAVHLFTGAGAIVFTPGSEERFIGARPIIADGIFDANSACVAIHRLRLQIDTVIISMFWQPAFTRDLVALEVNKIIDCLNATKETFGLYPRYVVTVLPEPEAPLESAGSEAMRTLIGYLTRHLLAEDVRLNLCKYARSDAGMGRTADAAFILCSGLLDEIRGQQLVISDR